MTETAAPLAGGEAQPIADANSIDTIVDNATMETHEGEASESEATETKPDEPFPKKAINALSRRDKQIGKLRAELAAERAAKEQIEQKYVKPVIQPSNDGRPKETEFNNYADYMEAVQDWKMDKKLSERDGKQQETQKTRQEQAWYTERENAVATKAQEFIKEIPDAQSVIDEHADIADDFSPGLQRLFLEADNASLAFYNLAKEGKLEDLQNMSLAKAAMEIGRAQTQVVTKQKTKAPTPLPASRGSVASGKQLETMNGNEIRSWLRSE